MMCLGQDLIAGDRLITCVCTLGQQKKPAAEPAVLVPDKHMLNNRWHHQRVHLEGETANSHRT